MRRMSRIVAFFAGCVMLFTAACRNTQDAGSLLVPGQPAAGLSTSPAAAYQFELRKDDLFSIALQKSSTGVRLSLLRPDGVMLRSVSCMHDGPMKISDSAFIAGKYTVRLQSCDEVNLTPYSISLSLSTPTSGDIEHIAAERLGAEAASLAERYTSEARQQAIVKYETALREWTRLGDIAEQVRVLTEMARLYAEGADFERALEYVDRAAGFAVGARVDKSEPLLTRALILLRKGNTTDSLTAATDGLNLARSSSNPAGEGKALYLIGRIHYEKSSYADATTALEKSVEAYRALGDELAVAHAKLYIAAVHFDLRGLDIARQIGDETFPVFESYGDRQGQAQALTFLGHFYSALNRKQEALNLYQQARVIVDAAADPATAFPLLNGIARVHFQLGDPKAATQFFRLALDSTRALGSRIDSAYVLRSIGQCYFADGDRSNALASLHEALKTFDSIPHNVMRAVVLEDIGIVLADEGKMASAVDHLNRSFQISTSIGHKENQARTLITLGEIREKAGDVKAALERYRKALDLYESIPHRLGKVTALNRIANAQRVLGRLDEALSNSDIAVGEIEKLRASLANPGLRTTYFASANEQYGLLIDILMRLHGRDGKREWAVRAFEASERARARSLLESIVETRASISVGVDPQLVEREATLRGLLDSTAERYDRLLKQNADPKLAARVSDEIRRLSAEYNGVDGQIRSQSPRYAALVQPEPLTLAAVQSSLLDDESRLLEYILGDEVSYLWVITKRDFTSFILPKRSEIESKVLEFRELLIARLPLPGEKPESYQARLSKAATQFPKVAAELSRMLLLPAAQHLGNSRLVIVADGALHYLPFAALPAPASLNAAEPEPLLVTHEVIGLPSASTLALIRKELPTTRPDLILALFADPVFEWTDSRVIKADAGNATADARVRGQTFSGGFELPRLEGSRREADSILALVPKNSQFAALGFDASKKAIMGDPDLKRFRILHFATHTRLVDDHPELSSLLLSLVDAQGNPQDGFLRLKDMYNLRIAAELVVLSACETALGKEVKGEGLISMVRGFMYAGTPRVIASLWKVDDDATAELMTEFYTQLLKNKRTAAAALREAQLKQYQKKSRRSPFYWAGFELQGEWR